MDRKLVEFMSKDIKMAGNVPTNAYGEIDFGSKQTKTAKYVRLAHDTSPEKVYTILTEHWGLKMPNLVISVTGGSRNFKLCKRLRKIFRKSLIKFAGSTGAWITTRGTNTGVVQHVGKAVKNYAAMRESDKMVTIGIAPWYKIQASDSLINSSNSSPSIPKVYTSPHERKYGKIMLDSNHSHFILVDNATDRTTDRFVIENELRANLESHLASKSRTDDSKVLIVCVIVGGGAGSFKTVHESIMKGIPVVAVQGSGGWSNVLASVSNKSLRSIDKDQLRKLLVEAKMERKHTDDMKRIEEWTNELNECLSRNLLSVFNDDPYSKAYNLDIAILQAVLKVGEKKVNEQLNLAMAWNRSDIARAHILTYDAIINKDDVEKNFFASLNENKPDFCRLLLEYGVDLKQACTVEKVESLYNNPNIGSVLHMNLKKYRQEGKFVLLDVGKVMEDFLDHSYVTVYKERRNGSRKYMAINYPVNNNNEGGNIFLDDPLRELFQWALLADFREIARCLWECMSEKIPAALAATKILKVLALKTFDLDKKNQMLQDANDYESLAIGIMTNCFEDKPGNATHLLIRHLEKWGGYTCLDLAIDAHDRTFVSTRVVQYVLDTAWMGKLGDDTNTAVILLAGFFPPLIWFGISLKEPFQMNSTSNDAKDLESAHEGTHRIEMTRVNNTHNDDDIQFNNVNIEHGSSKSQYSLIKKMISFYEAPIVTFWMNVVFFLVYLLLFAYILLCNFHPSVSVFEYILVAWTFTFLIEEIRELANQKARYLMDKIKLHMGVMWNKMDLMILMLFYVGFGIRFNSSLLNTARTFYAISFMIQCIRIVHIFAVHPVLGPKIVMLRKMVTDLLFFLFILIVFLLAYGVVSQALLYPNEGDVGTVIAGIIYKPYWLIYGQLFLEEINYNPNTDDFSCSNDTSSGLPRCPEQSLTVPILSGLYLLFANVLLLNLLIAMFSYSFDKVQQQASEIWKFQRYGLITDYCFKSSLVPPFIIISHFYLLIKLISRKIRKSSRNDPLAKALMINMTGEEVEKLTKWEKWHAEAFLLKKYQEDRLLPENQIRKISERMEKLMSTMESFQAEIRSRVETQASNQQV